VWYHLDQQYEAFNGKKHAMSEETPLVNGAEGNGGVPKQRKPPLWVFAILASFDLSATAIGGVGLQWVDASVNQMLRGSGVVFTAFFSIALLSRKLRWKQWGGILIVCMGLALVGMSGYLREQFSSSGGTQQGPVLTPSEVLLGVLLVLIGSALNAFQGVIEEKLMKAVGGAEVHPLELVGWEGVFGCIFAAFLMLPAVNFLPGSNCGSQENLLNTIYMIQEPFVFVCIIIFIFALMVMNYLSQEISKVLTAVHRQLISSIRAALVWGVEVFMYYVMHLYSYGETFDRWSWVQMAGFLCLVGGTLFYGRSKEAEEQQQLKPIATPVASPST